MNKGKDETRETDGTWKSQTLIADVHQHRRFEKSNHPKGRRKTSRDPHGKVLLLRREKGLEVRDHVDVARSRRHRPDLRRNLFPVRKTPRESALETLVSPGRRDRHDLRQTQNGQG